MISQCKRNVLDTRTLRIGIRISGTCLTLMKNGTYSRIHSSPPAFALKPTMDQRTPASTDVNPTQTTQQLIPTLPVFPFAAVSSEPTSIGIPSLLSPENAPPPGTLRVEIVSLKLDKAKVKCTSPLVRVAIGDQQHSTLVRDEPDHIEPPSQSDSNAPRLATWTWGDRFSLRLDYHTQLFSSLQVDVLNAHIFVPDSLVARAELRVSTLCTPATQPTSLSASIDADLNSNPTLKYTSSPTALPTAPTWRPFTLNLYDPHNAPSRRPHLHRPPPPASAALAAANHATPTRSAADAMDKAAASAAASSPDTTSSPSTSVGTSPVLKAAPLTATPPASFSEPTPVGTISIRILYVPLQLEDQGHDDTVCRLLNPTELSGVPAAVLETVLRALSLSKPTRQTLKQISKGLAVFKQGVEGVSPTEWACGVLLVMKYYESIEVPRTGKTVVNRNLFTKVLYFKQYAIAAYGWMGLVFFGKSTTIGDKRSMAAALPHISADDWLINEVDTNDVFQPSHFVVHDRREKALVICVRGTMSSVDAVTDLLCQYARLNDGMVHRGMKVAADWLAATLIPHLPGWVADREIDNIVIVGHSLGGGTSTLLTMLLHDHVLNGLRSIRPGLSMHCYAFAPPPVCSRNLALRYKDVITTIVNEHDVVCRLSYGSAIDLRTTVLAVIGKVDGHAAELMKLLSKNASAKDPTLADKFEVIRHTREHLKVTDENPKLYLAGTIYHIHYEHPDPATEPGSPISASVPGSRRASVVNSPVAAAPIDLDGAASEQTSKQSQAAHGHSRRPSATAWFKAVLFGTSTAAKAKELPSELPRSSSAPPGSSAEASPSCQPVSHPHAANGPDPPSAAHSTVSIPSILSTTDSLPPSGASKLSNSVSATSALSASSTTVSLDLSDEIDDSTDLAPTATNPAPPATTATPIRQPSPTRIFAPSSTRPTPGSGLGLSTTASPHLGLLATPLATVAPPTPTMSPSPPASSESIHATAKATAISPSTGKNVPVVVIIEESDCDTLAELVVRKNMFVQHMPDAYEKALGLWLAGDADELGVDG
ncbi:hypothetical protein BCR44DRAFT_1144032 [Catenaria anguillulae PL171]|uniref:sn-1-specific diacylglycerol lipase n=1 Tax=Catenaria anguillulae PL171 TaxID=765915 RepID=A0A1Y2HJM3_9FUNG|nr:hypothetical protein BCR44DRAFT_1144032 [Catenaria anguillulae PL171]